MPELLIVYHLPDGGEHEERWPSVAAFRAWAELRNQRLRYRVFRADEDGEWLLVETGSVAGSTLGSDT